MEDAPLISTYFVIAGRDFDVDYCSEFLELKPTTIWRQRMEHLKERQDLANVEWQVGFDKRPLYSLDEAVAEVLALVWPARERIRAFLAGGGLRAALTCDVTIHVDRPEYCLSPDVMEQLASLNCKFCLDIFDYSE